MTKFDNKINGNTVSADEYNNIVGASKNLIENSGQTIDSSNTQLSKAVANYVASGSFYTDSGIANAYVLNTTGSFQAPTELVKGLEIRFRTANPNSGASTVNVAGLGAVNIKLGDGTSDIPSGFITSGSDVKLRYDALNTAFIPSNEITQVNDLTINNKLNTQPNTATISSGAIAYTGTYMVVDTEGAAASDDLDTITGGTLGDRLLLQATASGQDVVLKDGTGNIALNLNLDVTLQKIHGDNVEFIYNGSTWVETGRNIYNDFLNSKSTNGYTYLPNGLIFQWGNASVSSGATVTLPVTFPNNIFNASVTHHKTSVSGAESVALTSTSQIRIYHSAGGTEIYLWTAIGY